MKTSNIKINEIYNSYKDLCKVLEEPIKSGCSKKAQLKEWECNFKWERIGNKYKILEIFDFVIHPTVKRKKGSKYSDLIYPILIYKMYNEFNNNNLFPAIVKRRIDYYYELGFAYQLYDYALPLGKKCDKLFFNELQEECRGIVYELFTRALDNLVRNNKISALKLYYVYRTDDEKDIKSYSISSLEQASYIKWNIDNVTNELGCGSLYEICKKNLYSKLKAMVNERLYIRDYQFESIAIRIALPNKSDLNILDIYSELFQGMNDEEVSQYIQSLRHQLNELVLTLVNTKVNNIIKDYNDLIAQEKVIESIINSEELIKKANTEVKNIKLIRDDYGTDLSIEQCVEIFKTKLSLFAEKIIKIA